MAKSHSRALAPRPIIVMAPRRGGRIRRTVRAVGRGARAVTRNRGGHKQLPVVGLGVGGAIAGYLAGKGYLDKLPQLGGSRVVTMGVAGYILQRMVKNKYAREAGVAMVVAAAFDFGKVQAGGTSGFEDDTMGRTDAGQGQGGGGGY